MINLQHMQQLEQLRNTLKDHGRSLTHPREIIFLALKDSPPLSMNQLVAACPMIDRASVYRTIILFEELGIVKRLQIGWKYQLELTDVFHHHHHLTCLKCGQVIHFDADSQLEARLAAIADRYTFSSQDHQLEIQGVCANCR
jgi:Fur family ferric uptake transcriptional regulator